MLNSNTGVYLLPYGDLTGSIDYSGVYTFNGSYTFNNTNLLIGNALPHGVPDLLSFNGTHRFGDGHLFGETQGIYTLQGQRNKSYYTETTP